MSEDNEEIESSGNDSDQQESGGKRRSRGSTRVKHQRMVGRFMASFVPFSF